MNRLVAFALFALALSAQDFSPPPWVRPGSIVNAASHLPMKLPGSALAPGAIVELEGLHFDPADVHVEIEAGGPAAEAVIVNATRERILVRMPLLNRTGAARLFVTSRRKRSVGSEITLGAAAFGIYTVNGKGWGPAAALDSPGGSPVQLPPVHRGDRVTLSGTGLGKASARGPEIYVGGHWASAVSRTQTGGVEHLSFIVPAEAPAGCAVPLMVRIGETFSNTSALSVETGASCASAELWFEHAPAVGETSGAALLLHSDVILELRRGNPVPFALDTFSGEFTRRIDDTAATPLALIPPAGSCVSWSGGLSANELILPALLGAPAGAPDTGLDLGPEVAAQTAALLDLDAGPELALTGPIGARTAVRSQHKPRVYSGMLGGNPPVQRIQPTPLFLNPGEYRIAIPGGVDVSPAVASLRFPEPIRWRNRDTIAVLDRALGVQSEWTTPSGYTALVFAWNIDRRNSLAGFALCVAPPGATKFRIPPSALAHLPVTSGAPSELSLGFLGVAAVPLDPVPFRAKGIDRGTLIAASLAGRTVIVK